MKGIGKSFGPVSVLEDVDFDLLAGEVHVLAGENGAGKSTLIKILGGVYADYAGEIILDSRALRFKSVHDATAYGIALIHQELSLAESLSVVDNIFLARERSHFSWLQRGVMLTQARSLLDDLDLDIDLRCPVEDYPVGIKQMIEIAKALSLQSRIMVMDEPTSSLTEPEVERLFRLIALLKERGVGLIYITHKMEEIYRIGDRITVLRDGRAIGTERKEHLPHDKLVQWMVGRSVQEPSQVEKSQDGEVLLELSDFSVPAPAIRGSYVVDRVNLEARAGEIVGLAGLQGSGNSALLNGIFGTFGKAVEGEVRVTGESYSAFDPRQAIKRGLGLVTNDRKATGLIPSMNITRNVTLASLKRFSRYGFLQPHAETQSMTEQARSLNLKAPDFDSDVFCLSGGNQQKLVLAKWLLTKPKVLLLDDPCRGVDIGAKQELYALLHRLCAQGVAILLVSSELPELLSLSDRILVMHRGRVTLELNREDATQEKILYGALGERKSL